MSNTIPLPESFLILSRLQSGTEEVCRLDETMAYAAALSAADNAALKKTNASQSVQIISQSERIKLLEDALRFYLEVYENVPDAIDRYGDWYQTDEAKLADTGAREALGEKNG